MGTGAASIVMLTTINERGLFLSSQTKPHASYNFDELKKELLVEMKVTVDRLEEDIQQFVKRSFGQVNQKRVNEIVSEYQQKGGEQ
jgi:hypothetical protein